MRDGGDLRRRIVDLPEDVLLQITSHLSLGETLSLSEATMVGNREAEEEANRVYSSYLDSIIPTSRFSPSLRTKLAVRVAKAGNPSVVPDANTKRYKCGKCGREEETLLECTVCSVTDTDRKPTPSRHPFLLFLTALLTICAVPRKR